MLHRFATATALVRRLSSYQRPAASPMGLFAAASGVVLVGAHIQNAEAQGQHAVSRKPRVLVTGFHDWKDCQNNIYRCRDNPSCRLILGLPQLCPSVGAPRLPQLPADSGLPQIGRSGELPQLLRERRPDIEWNFQTLPTIWMTACPLDLLNYDAVIHLGCFHGCLLCC